MSTAVDHDRDRPVYLSVIVPVYNECHLVAASVRRLLALSHPLIARLQVVVVDDCSTDSSWEVINRFIAPDPRVIAVRHERNQGKGAAIRTGIQFVEGDITVFHDADLEYDPDDLPRLLVPFVKEGADAVFGSRYMAAEYRRALMFRHSVMNRALTALSNVFTDLDLTDVETCYKAVRTSLLRSMPVRSDDFRVEIELALKLSKRRARVFEVPIRYLPRSYAEGKKIRARDGLLALLALIKFSLIDDLYAEREYESRIVRQFERTHRLMLWLGDTIRPFVGDRVLEIGAGLGIVTDQLIPRESYVVSDSVESCLRYLQAYALGKPYLDVRALEFNHTEVPEFEGRFDTVLLLNVLEHVEQEQAALRGVRRWLQADGCVIVMVPQGRHRFGTLDEALGRYRRYDEPRLREVLDEAGFRIERLIQFSRFSVLGWWLNGKVLKRKRFSRVQLKLLDVAVPLLRGLDRLLPVKGLSLIAIARRL